MKIFNYSIDNVSAKSGNKTIITIDGVIGMGWTGSEDSKNTTERINALLKEVEASDSDTILVKLNSPGGLVSHGLTIHDALKAHSASIEVEISGMTASAATLIAMAADPGKLTMSKNAMMLIHRAWVGVMGNKNDIEATKKTLESMDDIQAGIYSERTGLSTDAVISIMDRNNGKGEWLTSAKAEKEGLIDSVFEPGKTSDVAASAEMIGEIVAMGFPAPEGFDIPKKPKAKAKAKAAPKKKSKPATTIYDNYLMESGEMSDVKMLEEMRADAVAAGNEHSVKAFDKMIENAKASDEKIKAFEEEKEAGISARFEDSVSDVKASMDKVALPDEVKATVEEAFKIEATGEVKEQITAMVSAFAKALDSVKIPAISGDVAVDVDNAKADADIENKRGEIAAKI